MVSASKRLSPACLVLLLTLQIPLGLDAAEKFRAANGGFGTAIHGSPVGGVSQEYFSKMRPGCGVYRDLKRHHRNANTARQ